MTYVCQFVRPEKALSANSRPTREADRRGADSHAHPRLRPAPRAPVCNTPALVRTTHALVRTTHALVRTTHALVRATRAPVAADAPPARDTQARFPHNVRLRPRPVCHADAPGSPVLLVQPVHPGSGPAAVAPRSGAGAALRPLRRRIGNISGGPPPLLPRHTDLRDPTLQHRRALRKAGSFGLVRKRGLEPSRPCGRQPLTLVK